MSGDATAHGRRFSVVVPVYNNAGSIADLLDALSWLDAELGDVEAVFVVDGSPDDSSELIRKGLVDCRFRARVIDLARNFGSFTAIRVGLSHAEGEYIAVMAADLQEPITAIRDFLVRLTEGDVDVVVGRRTGRRDPAMAATTARLYWWGYRRLVNDAIPAGGVDVFACRRNVARVLAGLPETHTSLVALLYWVGFRRVEMPYERQERHSGRSAWTLRKRMRYLADSVYAFTDLPVIVLQLLGVAGVVGSLLVAGVVLVGWWAGIIVEPGYTPLMLVITFSTSLILIGLGVVGSYVWRAYENGKQRPVAIVRGTAAFGGNEAFDHE